MALGIQVIELHPDIWDLLVMRIITKGPIYSYMHNTFPSLMEVFLMLLSSLLQVVLPSAFAHS